MTELRRWAIFIIFSAGLVPCLVIIFSAVLVPCLVILFFSTPAFADHVYVAPATGSGVSDSDLTTATQLVRTSVPDVSSNDVVNDATQADFVLQPGLIRLGQAYVLTLAKVKNGTTVNASQMKAEKMDELDKVAQRLTRSVLAGQRAVEKPRVGEITDQEASDGTQRRPTRKAVYLGFGGASLGHLNTTGIGYSLGTAYTWDVNVARIKLMGEGDINGSAFFVSGGLGANYYFSPEDIAPYVSGDFGAGAAKQDLGILSGQLVGGFVLGIGAGVELLRTASINVDLGFRAAFLLHDNSLGLPEAMTLRLGVYF